MYKPKLKMNPVEPVGHYAVRIHWNDGHSTGQIFVDRCAKFARVKNPANRGPESRQGQRQVDNSIPRMARRSRSSAVCVLNKRTRLRSEP